MSQNIWGYQRLMAGKKERGSSHSVNGSENEFQHGPKNYCLQQVKKYLLNQLPKQFLPKS